MLLDCHIHLAQANTDAAAFIAALEENGVAGGSVLSLCPQSFPHACEVTCFQDRLEDLIRVTQGQPNVYSFFWIDPLEYDALEQVRAAVERGVTGFKVICNRFYPRDDAPMEVFRAIAAADKPLMFHSGILWDGMDTSRYNRPGEFEALLDVAGLKFSMAHISWPWCDELLAVYGKFLNAYALRPDVTSEMFIDTTPGTPAIYRKDALTKVFTIGYDIKRNVIFGTDNHTHSYGGTWLADWVGRDTGIMREAGLEDSEIERVFSGNLLRFVGAVKEEVKLKPQIPAQ